MGATTAFVLAAGHGSRLGADKALVELGGGTAIERVIATLRAAGVEDIAVVRRRGAAPLPDALRVARIECETDSMIESLRAAWRTRAQDSATRVMVFPIDHAAVDVATVRALLAAAGSIVLPSCRGRRGHPLVLAREVFAEIVEPSVASLRDVIRSDPSRVCVVEVEDGFVHRDIDTPEDLAAARGHLANVMPATVLMARHRSRRGYASQPVGDAQLRWIVDVARHASTSSFIQAYSVVAVRDASRRDRIAALCADQEHIRQAPLFLAICADLAKIALACERHGKRLNARSLEVFLEAVIDASLLGQNLQLAAESEGLGACMIGAARDNPRELAAELSLPKGCFVVFGMTVGWPDDDPEPRGRMPLDAVLHEEQWSAAALPAALDAADDAMRAWARRSNSRHTGPSRKPIREDRGWTDRMAFLFGGAAPHKGREELGAHLRALGFGLDGDAG